MKTRARLALVVASSLALAGVGTTIVASAGAAFRPPEQVSTSGTDSGNCVSSPCATINYAISQATPGTTIDVAAGTYNQTVDINKSIKLVGAGASSTTLDGSNLDPSSNGYYGIVYVGNAGGPVTVEDFTITNPYPYSYTGGEPEAVALADQNSGDKVNILNNTITEGNSDANASNDFPIGIDGFLNGATTTIGGNAISGFFQGSLLEDNGPASVTYNKFTNLIASGGYAAEGLFFLADENGTYNGQDATNNTFSGYSGYGIAEEAGYTGGAVTPGCVANGSIVTNLKGNHFALTGGQTATGVALRSNGTGNNLGGSVANESGYVTAPSNAIEVQSVATSPTPQNVTCSPYSNSNGGGGTLDVTENNDGIGVKSATASTMVAGQIGGLHVPRHPRHA